MYKEKAERLAQSLQESVAEAIAIANRPNHNALLVKAILEQATAYEWSMQGFGMMRLYLTDEVRIHVWDDTYRVPDVTLIHNHPWDFYSEVIAGALENTLYRVFPDKKHSDEVFDGGPNELIPYDEVVIKAGEGAFVKETLRRVYLRRTPPPDDPHAVSATYGPGMHYTQNADEVHSTSALNGTVTLCTRRMRPDKPRDDALVYCVPERGFVSAAPRPATYEEVAGATRRALETWF